MTDNTAELEKKEEEKKSYPRKRNQVLLDSLKTNFVCFSQN